MLVCDRRSFFVRERQAARGDYLTITLTATLLPVPSEIVTTHLPAPVDVTENSVFLLPWTTVATDGLLDFAAQEVVPFSPTVTDLV